MSLQTLILTILSDKYSNGHFSISSFCQLCVLQKTLQKHSMPCRASTVQKIVVQSDCTGICTILTLIKTTKPTSVLGRRPNSDLLFMPYYELSTWITVPTIKFLLIWSVVVPCSRKNKFCWCTVLWESDRPTEKMLRRTLFPT